MSRILRRYLFVLPCIAAVLAEPASAQTTPATQSWKSSDGRVIEARFVRTDAGAVVIERDGKQFSIPFANLAPESVEMAKGLAAKAAAAPPEHMQRSLMLEDGWDKGLQKGDVSIANFLHVLQLAGVEPKVDLMPQDIELYPGIKYLDPAIKARVHLTEVKKARSLNSSTRLAAAGFPGRSLSTYDFSGDFEGFGHFILVVDAADQVVAVQLVQNNPQSRMLNNHRTDWLVYNFLQSRRKSKSDYRVGYSTSPSKDVVEIRSEVIDESGKSREWVKLRMASRFASISRFILEQYR